MWDGIEKRSVNAQAERALAEKAHEAARVISDAAAVAIKTIASAAAVAQAVTQTDIAYIKQEVSAIKIMLDSKYVTKESFLPVRIIAFGMVGLILVAVIGALMTMILTRKP